jgi:hypothetical protein
MKISHSFSTAALFLSLTASSAMALPQVGVVNGPERITFELKDGKVLVRTFKKSLDDGTVCTAADMADPEDKGKRFLLETRSFDEATFKQEFRLRIARLDPSRLSEDQKIQLERIRSISMRQSELTENQARQVEIEGQISSLELEEAALDSAKDDLNRRRKKLAQAKRDFPKVDYSNEEKALDREARTFEERKKARDEQLKRAKQDLADIQGEIQCADARLEESTATLEDLEKVYDRMVKSHGGLLGLGDAKLNQILTLEVNKDGILFNLLLDLAKMEEPGRKRREPRRGSPEQVVGQWKGELGVDLTFEEARRFCARQGLKLPTTEDFKELFKSGRSAEVLSEDGSYWAVSPLSAVTIYLIDKTGAAPLNMRTTDDQAKTKWSVRCVDKR